MTFSNPASTATYAGFSQTGVYVLRLTVGDSQLTAYDEVTVTVTENGAAPSVEILTPLDGADLTEPTQLTGNVSGGNWKVEYALQTDTNLNNLAWITLNQGTGAVTNGTLATIDPTLMLNGMYVFRLTSVQNNLTIADDISLVFDRNLKVGHFTVSFDDMSVPVAGIPIQVVRTYDSRDKRNGDFGAGWTLSLRNIRLEKSRVLGLNWYQSVQANIIPKYCVEATRPHLITVTQFLLFFLGGN